MPLHLSLHWDERDGAPRLRVRLVHEGLAWPIETVSSFADLDRLEADVQHELQEMFQQARWRLAEWGARRHGVAEGFPDFLPR